APFHDPATGLDGEAARAGRALHHLQIPPGALLLTPRRQLLAAIGGIRPDLREARNEVRETAEQFVRADGIMRIGGGPKAGDRQPQGIDQEMPLPTLHAFVAVVAADASRLFDRLDALTVHDGGARVGVAAHALAFRSM